MAANVFAGTGIFSGQRIGQMDLAVAAGKVVSMKIFYFFQVDANLLHEFDVGIGRELGLFLHVLALIFKNKENKDVENLQ